MAIALVLCLFTGDMIVILVFIFQQNSSVCFIASILTERRAIFHLCVVFTESVPAVMSVELMNFHDYCLGFLIHSSIIQLPLSHLCCKMALLSLTRGPFIIFAGVFEMS